MSNLHMPAGIVTSVERAGVATADASIPAQIMPWLPAGGALAVGRIAPAGTALALGGTAPAYRGDIEGQA